jgi:HEAT repeat protein
MDKYLIDLIERMSDTSDQTKEKGYESSQTISWKALREAEKINNIDFISDLIIFIDKEKNKIKRGHAYFVLGHIAKNTNNEIALNYLIQRVEKETDKYIISTLLDMIANIKKPIGTDLQPLIKMTKNEKWLIRHTAIRSLNYSLDILAENILIEIIEKSEDVFDIVYSNATLNKIGTLSAIPYLEKHLKSKKRDIKHSAKYAIEEIKKRHQN